MPISMIVPVHQGLTGPYQRHTVLGQVCLQFQIPLSSKTHSPSPCNSLKQKKPHFFSLLDSDHASSILTKIWMSFKIFWCYETVTSYLSPTKFSALKFPSDCFYDKIIKPDMMLALFHSLKIVSNCKRCLKNSLSLHENSHAFFNESRLKHPLAAEGQHTLPKTKKCSTMLFQENAEVIYIRKSCFCNMVCEGIVSIYRAQRWRVNWCWKIGLQQTAQLPI